jgi:hypothetical protein
MARRMRRVSFGAAAELAGEDAVEIDPSLDGHADGRAELAGEEAAGRVHARVERVGSRSCG